MPRNIEVKVQVPNLKEIEALIPSVFSGVAEPTILNQCDTFFNCVQGRLKLRCEDAKSQIIFYKRSDSLGPKLSTYSISPVSDPDALRDVLSQAYGIKGEVKKRRVLYIVGQTRVHLDSVVGLGTFMELEVVLTDDQSIEDGAKIADEILKSLDISSEGHIEGAYMDLILKK